MLWQQQQNISHEKFLHQVWISGVGDGGFYRFLTLTFIMFAFEFLVLFSKKKRKREMKTFIGKMFSRYELIQCKREE